ncbi:ATP-binding cassette domain-containing protein [Aeromicrobium sp. 636]|uniref:ABC transporter ATP-binding protein n=1 Tax=Aeromicrobium senzhongii TaxID=2663859 RepID=A0A8I0ET95_9ACTN|nr:MULTISPECIES: ABC transporter ATP-binding protein [Aeromicrobium]MBC9224982.1 ABC transporter ATP-binding protein [Aeromicrobium senzhongii]MCQ3997093.1 ATP-binding cassette domain-containing protein [Aeromicrobium sp. 636]MTB87027.1 ATP-binding cassette domain-containing protein [Aeromicrobium senzhongii]QNL93152.1 ABC transporter ATP-binding protein [Aeromicrobium senzhongii]
MIKISGLNASYEAVDVLHGIDITANDGELTVILGANGSGKSTLFKAMSGVLRPNSGSVEFNGEDITRSSPAAIVKKGLAHCPEGRHLFPRMSVEKNLMLGAYVRRGDKSRVKTLLERSYDLFPVLREKRKQAAGSLSGGQQQMVAIGRSLMSDPSMLILDEPSMGLAPLITQQVFETIVEINNEGIGVLLAEQNANSALQIATSGYVLAEGRVVLSGSAKELQNDARVQRAYLGV